ncbi:DUF87 domain-containing protein [Candidatus Woesearchaeota archaeon]|nr:DUF87 domain-containing protein [Candidatus Woesearchaeota archaeon]
MYEIIIGRDEEDRKRFGTKGTILLGRHYVKMGETTSLSNNVLLDVVRSHVVFVCGKRGSGKSYTMGVIAEGMSNLPAPIARNTAILIFDTMGVYWTLRYENKREVEELQEWGLTPQKFDIRIFVPYGFYKKYRSKGIPADAQFSISPSELEPSDWCMTFGVSINDPIGVAIERVVSQLKKRGSYSIDDIIKALRKDSKIDTKTKNAVENRFVAAKSWGLFRKDATPIKDLISRDKITVLDISCYASAVSDENLRALVIGMVSQKLFNERMVARKEEEYKDVEDASSIFDTSSELFQLEFPLVWLIVDEAHEFLPNDVETPATKPLITILREGRQPGISLVLASQQPGKIATDVMTQSDIVIAHRITSEVDIKALGMLMQSYLREDLNKYLDNLPREPGAALVFDDTNERMYAIRVRPRLSWHGGSSPTAIQPGGGIEF